MKKNTFISLFVLVSMLFLFNACKKHSVTTIENLAKQPTYWKASTDSFGSLVSYFNLPQNSSDSVIDVGFVMTSKNSPDEFPYVELICSPKNDFTDIFFVEIEYKCSHELLVKLSQSDFGENGLATYAHYQSVLPVSDKLNKVKIALTDFTQPQWADSVSLSVQLDMKNVNAIYLAPNMNYEKGDTANLSIYSLKMIGK